MTYRFRRLFKQLLRKWVKEQVATDEQFGGFVLACNDSRGYKKVSSRETSSDLVTTAKIVLRSVDDQSLTGAILILPSTMTM